MRASQQLVFLDEESEVSACLEVIRRVLQPEGRSLPHITLRYSSKPMKPSALSLYEDLAPSGFVLDQVSTFDARQDGSGIETLILLCDFETLEHVSYRPDFPQSVFHLSLYVGDKSILAETLLRMIKGLPWGLLVNAPVKRFVSSKEAAAASSLSWRCGAWLTDRASLVFRQAVHELNLDDDIRILTPEMRLAVAFLVASRLHESPEIQVQDPLPNATLNLPSLRLGSKLAAAITAHEVDALAVPAGQMAFWSEDDIRLLSPGSEILVRRPVSVHSTFITPPELSLDVVDAALSYKAPDDLIDFGDPAIGAGIFFASVRKQLGQEWINSARGIEIDPHSAARTRHRWRRSPLSVITGDFLQQPPEHDTWNLLLANPPYRRSQLLDSSLEPLRQQLESALQLKISRRSDLYLYFVLRAHQWMKRGAIAAWILPSEFLVTDYGKALRTYLSQNVQLLRIHTFEQSEAQFDNALTSTSVVVLRNTEPASSDQVRVTRGGSLKAPRAERMEFIADLVSARRWSFEFLDRRRASHSSDRRIGDFFSVKRGLATGANKLFVLSDEQVVALRVDRQFIKPILPRAIHIPNSYVGVSTAGLPEPASGRWLIDTDWSIPRIRSVSPLFAEYLVSIEAAAQESVLVRRRQPFYKQELSPRCDLVFVYMAKATVPTSRRFIANESDAVALNNYLILSLRDAWVDRAARLGIGRIALRAALARIEPAELLSEGRLYGRNLLKLEPTELSRVLMPPDNIWDLLLDS